MKIDSCWRLHAFAFAMLSAVAATCMASQVSIGSKQPDFVRIGSVPATPAVGLQFVAPEIGWIAANGELWATADGGHTWVRHPHEAENVARGLSNIRDFHFSGSGHGWMLTYSSLYCTVDAGLHWRDIRLPAAFVPHSGELDATFFSSDCRSAWTGGGVYGAPPKDQTYFDNSAVDDSTGAVRVLYAKLYRTVSGGIEWQNVPLSTDDYRIFRIAFSSVKNGLIFSDHSIYWTSDAGERWNGSNVGGLDGVEGKPVDISFVGCCDVWAAYTDGSILHSSDAGHAWRLLPHTQIAFGRLFFTTPLVGWALDVVEGSLYTTQNGGSTWTKVKLNVPVQDFFALDSRHMWVISNGSIFVLK